MAKKPRAGNSYKTQYKAYKVKNQWRKNRLARFEKRALNNENDTSALEAFEKSTKTYGRGKPGNKGWFHPQEQKLLRECNSDDETIRIRAKEKLAKLQEVYSDNRPSAIRNAEKLNLPLLAVDQLLNIGVINAKRHKAFKSRLGSVRGRRAVSNRR